jgi:2-succinyl-6-hydroxy-2,4-cyclohexadiene-1-carboxylate synthase
MPSSTKSQDKVVVALNGFLGRASDWGLIENLLPPGWTLQPVELLKEPLLADYDEWAARFSSEIMRTNDPGSTKVLLGYSMGGRLGLHSLVKSPNLFSGALIVSANPGLLDEDERRLRTQADEIWAGRFLREAWPRLMSEWDGQAALRPPKLPGLDAITLDRKETEFERAVLAQALRTWSLGRQRNLRTEVAALKLPIEFVTGKDDLKFSAIARDFAKVQAAGAREHVIVDHAGHRVPWDAPAQFRTILAKFLSRW